MYKLIISYKYNYTNRLSPSTTESWIAYGYPGATLNSIPGYVIHLGTGDAFFSCCPHITSSADNGNLSRILSIIPGHLARIPPGTCIMVRVGWRPTSRRNSTGTWRRTRVLEGRVKEEGERRAKSGVRVRRVMMIFERNTGKSRAFKQTLHVSHHVSIPMRYAYWRSAGGGTKLFILE